MKTGDKLYLLGPMTGIRNDNRDLFNRAAKELRRLGYAVINPAVLDAGGPVPARTLCYARDLPYLVGCDAGMALPGWRRSIGASLEAAIFNALERPVLEWPSLRFIPSSKLPKIVHPRSVKTAT
jgi:hypothetical protein